MIYMLLILTISFILLIIYLSYKDILSPSFVMLFMYLFSVISSIIGFLTWNTEKNLNLNTYILVIIGLLAFCFGELAARIYKTNKKKFKIKIVNNRYPTDIFTLTSSFFIIITIFIAIIEINKICKNYGFQGNSLPQMLKFFREKNDILSGGNLNAAYDLSFITKQFIKICYVLTIYFEYFYVKSIIDKNNKNMQNKYLLCIILGLVCTLLSTGRSILFHMLYAFFVMYIIYNRQSPNGVNLNTKNFKKKFIKIGIFLIIMLYALMPLLGRTNTGGMIESTSFAIGTHIPTLNRGLRDKTDDMILNGINLTFNNAQQSLSRLGLIKNYKNSINIWYRFKNYSSNTFTSLYAYNHDYGIIGVFILQFLFGFIVTRIYLSIKKNSNLLALIFYSYFFYTIIDQVRGDQVYGLINIASIAFILIIYFVYFQLFYVKQITKEV